MKKEKETETEIKDLPDLPEGLSLQLQEGRLTLTDGKLSLYGDFVPMAGRLKYNNLTHELLVKAVRGRNAGEELTVLDATAGMGEDSLLLAAAGFHVRLYEQNPVIAALLSDTLRRAGQDPSLGPVVDRMELIRGDSIEAMRRIGADRSEKAVQVIYLDPMFPAREKSGLIKKKFQLLQQLECPCTEEEALMEAALQTGAQKIVVKRPAKGPFLAGRKPSYTLEGKAIRYDCYVM